MTIRHGRDLRKMRHAHDLLAERDLKQLFADTLRGNAGNAGIDLVKNHGLNRIVLREHIFHRQHYAAQLTAGGDAADTAKLFTGVCRHCEAYLVAAAAVKSAAAFYRRKLNGKAHGRHTQAAQLLDYTALKLLRGGMPRLAQGFGGFAGLLFLRFKLSFELGYAVVGVLDIVKLLPILVQQGYQPVLVAGIFALELAQFRRAAFKLIVFFG